MRRGFEIAKEARQRHFCFLYRLQHDHAYCWRSATLSPRCKKKPSVRRRLREMHDSSMVADLIAAQLTLMRTLQGADAEFHILRRCANSSKDVREAPSWRTSVWPGHLLHWIRKLQACVLAGEHAAALDAATKAEGLLWTSPALFELAEYHFYAALACARRFRYGAGRQNVSICCRRCAPITCS